MAVDPLFAQWLQAAADYVVRVDSGALQKWGATALATERSTGIATRASATVAADSEIAFLSRGPFVQEVHQIVGTDWITTLGTVISVHSNELGYDSGIDVFVLEVEVDRASGISTLTVLRPLRIVS